MFIKRLTNNSEFGRNVLTLITGTTLAQAITLAVSPLLTRIYSPENFGIFALFLAVTSVMSVVATGRYEQVVMLPQRDEDAVQVVALSVMVASLFSLCLFVPIALSGQQIAGLLKNPKLDVWLYLIPFSVFLMGVYNTAINWLNRRKQFKTIGTNRVIQSSLIAAGQLLLSFSGGAAGLMAGFVGGWLAVTALAARAFDHGSYRFSLDSIAAQARRYKDYPLYSAPGALLDCASVQVPVFMLAFGFEPAIAGYFSLATRAISAPLSIISSSVGQVYFQKVSVLIYEEPKRIRTEIFLTAKKLALISLCIFLPLFFMGSDIFGYLFGAKWHRAGEYVEIIAPALMVRFVVSPLSAVLLATGDVRLCTLWQLLYFVSTTVVLGGLIGYPVTTFLTGFVVNEVVLYSIYFLMIISASKKAAKRQPCAV